MMYYKLVIIIHCKHLSLIRASNTLAYRLGQLNKFIYQIAFHHFYFWMKTAKKCNRKMHEISEFESTFAIASNARA